MKNFCIRDDYVARTEAETYVDDSGMYWNESRIAASDFYQYYVYRKAAEFVARMDQCSFVDIGCGYPRKVKELISPLTEDITLIDQPSMQALVNERFPDMKFIPLNLQHEDDTLQPKFDLVVCADVIEHLLDPGPLLEFIKRVLAPGGVAIISTPERDIERGVNCLSSPMAEHVREWNSGEFVAYLQASGFKVFEHSLMPKGRLTWLEEKFVLSRQLKTRRYGSCQVAVCGLA